jgi:hypothetical protein
MAILKDATKFTCRVCGETLRFDPWDESTYTSKTEHEDFFGLQLATYRVAHDSGNERHYNSVVVDQRGFFRGHRDAYSEPIRATDAIVDRDYWLFHEEKPSEPNDKITLALLISRKDRWIVDIVCPVQLKAPELATIVMDRVEEAWRIYNSMPDLMETRLANLDVHIWASASRVLVVSFKDTSLLNTLQGVVNQIIDGQDDGVVPRRRVLSLIFRILERDSSPSFETLSRIITEDMLFATFHTPFEDRIPSIVERTAQRFPIAEEILGPLLRGYTTLIEILEDKYCSKYKEVFDLIDYVNRRRILG